VPLDGEVLLRHVKTAGIWGAASLRHELARRRGLAWGTVRNGVADFPREVLEAFSTRTGELTEELLQLVDAGFNADAATQRGSRAAQRVLSDPEVETIQQRRLAEVGYSVDQIRQLGAQVTKRPSLTDTAEQRTTPRATRRRGSPCSGSDCAEWRARRKHHGGRRCDARSSVRPPHHRSRTSHLPWTAVCSSAPGRAAGRVIGCRALGCLLRH
jgi:hypothetical protein